MSLASVSQVEKQDERGSLSIQVMCIPLTMNTNETHFPNSLFPPHKRGKGEIPWFTLFGLSSYSFTISLILWSWSFIHMALHAFAEFLALSFISVFSSHIEASQLANNKNSGKGQFVNYHFSDFSVRSVISSTRKRISTLLSENDYFFKFFDLYLFTFNLAETSLLFHFIIYSIIPLIPLVYFV